MLIRSLLSIAALTAFLWRTAVSAGPPSKVFSFHREHVLGTSLEVQVAAADEEIAQAAERAAVAEIERLAKILSSYDPESELRRWQSRPNEAVPVSLELFEMLRACERWTAASRGAFHPGVEGLSRLWREAAAVGAAPSRQSLDDQLQICGSLNGGWKRVPRRIPVVWRPGSDAVS